MAKPRFQFDSPDEAASARLAGWLAVLIDTPKLIFLNGDLGAGKTAFARGFIRARCGQATDVPSPTFALIQPYQNDTAHLPILHADLYRLADPQEIDELGLSDALADHICLVEWPQNGHGVLPEADIKVSLTPQDTGREIIIEAEAALCKSLEKAAARDAELEAFLAATDWHDAVRAPLAGDASTRRYERIYRKTENQQDSQDNAVLMDWPAMPDGPPIYDGQPYSRVAHLAEAMPRFTDMVTWLRAAGLAAPALFAHDQARGFALLEDFGDRNPANDATLDRAVFYYEAVENLLHLHSQPAPDFLPPYNGAVQAVETSLFVDWYLPWRGIAIDDAAKRDWQAVWRKLGDALMSDDKVAVLRDYHSVNLLWRDHAQARHRIGLIDVQDALSGSPAYDLASLIFDARIDVPADFRENMLAHYMRRFGDDAARADKFRAALSLCTVQRNLKIAGIFVRLAERDGKPAYLKHMPRIIGYLTQALEAPALKPVADWLNAHAPSALGLVDMADD
ncbi:MAG: tRNA (adenosine(37)-N6)-threonylcarbamoyltransferase complex ATPase subunit type 1 TsaE [Alphaproteobacteria bacterium]|nr:tRNA (adenosine(37)-N6)-threonylcarbamoyltransferase complex ATPase subunit type 1 TsaE [Alphaproteobacteria bacterium]